MNDKTGMAYFFKDKEEIAKLKKELEALQQSITLLQRGPTAKCPCCKGNGSVQIKEPFYDEHGKIHRFIPCFCTFLTGESKEEPQASPASEDIPNVWEGEDEQG